MSESPDVPVDVADRVPEHVQVQMWLSDLEEALSSGAVHSIADCFVEDAHWRDLVAFTWDFSVHSGRDTVSSALADRARSVRPGAFVVDPRRTPPRVVTRGGREVIEAFFTFETAVGWGQGVLRLESGQLTRSGLRAWVFFTRLDGLHGIEPRFTGPRPEGLGFDRSDTRLGWQDLRDRESSFADRDPDALIVGGGQSGVMAAAHLKNLGLDALIVDRFPRIGDNWRTRYKSLALHNGTDMNHFSFLPFPSWYPEYLPKDKLANWFEIYVEALELNYWTSTELVSAVFEEATGRWAIVLRRADGSERAMHPKHLIMATGNTGGTPRIPNLPGIDEFAGSVVHTKHFTEGKDYAGQRVLVVGVGTSAHDVAYDMHINGATVTMMQRGTISVVDLESANMSYPMYFDGTPLEEADLLGGAGFVLPLLMDSLRGLTRMTTRRDQDLLAQLEARGMRLDDGDHGTGWLMKFYTKGGGYYINVGASELIASGKISLIQATDTDRFEKDGLQMRDGRHLPFDAVVLATGYESQAEEVRRIFGDDVADRLGGMWGFDERGVLRNAWRRTAQPNLWFMMSGIQSARFHAPLVALQIAADLMGLVDVPNPYLPSSAATLQVSSDG